MTTASIVIPTYNRDTELEQCLASIAVQTRLPQEVAVVDDGHIARFYHRDELEALGVRCLYVKKDTPGLTESRAAGVAATSGDVVLFLDDDDVLEPEYVERIMDVYEADAEGRVMGVGAMETNIKPLTLARRLRRAWDVLFLVQGFREGRNLASGFYTEYGSTGSPHTEPAQVDFLSGNACSFRRPAFDLEPFIPHYHEYALDEDKDFSFRVSRHGPLVYTPHAKLLHQESPSMRPDKRSMGRRFLMGRYLCFRNHMRQGWWGWPLFWYAALGYTLARVMVAVLSMQAAEFGRVRGILETVTDIAARRLPPGALQEKEERP